MVRLRPGILVAVSHSNQYHPVPVKGGSMYLPLWMFVLWLMLQVYFKASR